MSNRRDPYGRQSKTEKESKETNSGQDTLLNPNMFNNIQGLDPNQPLYSTVQQPQAQAPTESTVLPTSLSNDGMAAQQLISESVAASSSGGPVHPSNSLFNRIKLPAEHKTQPVQSVLAFAAALPPVDPYAQSGMLTAQPQPFSSTLSPSSVLETAAASSSGGLVHPTNSLFNRIKPLAEPKPQPVQSVLAFAASLPPVDPYAQSGIPTAQPQPFSSTLSSSSVLEIAAASSSGGLVHPTNSLFNRIKPPEEPKPQSVQSVLAFAASLPPVDPYAQSGISTAQPRPLSSNLSSSAHLVPNSFGLPESPAPNQAQETNSFLRPANASVIPGSNSWFVPPAAPAVVQQTVLVPSTQTVSQPAFSLHPRQPEVILQPPTPAPANPFAALGDPLAPSTTQQTIPFKLYPQHAKTPSSVEGVGQNWNPVTDNVLPVMNDLQDSSCAPPKNISLFAQSEAAPPAPATLRSTAYKNPFLQSTAPVSPFLQSTAASVSVSSFVTTTVSPFQQQPLITHYNTVPPQQQQPLTMGLRPIKRHGVFYHQPPPGPDYRQLVRNIMVKRNPTEIPRRSKVSLFESASESRKQNIIEEPEGTQSGYGNMEGYDGTRVNRKAFAVSRPPKHGRKDGEKKVYVKPLILGPRIAKRRLEEDVDEEKSMKEEEKKKVKFSTPHGLQLGCGYPEMIRRQEKARQIQEERKNKEGRLGRETVAQRRERRVHWTPEMRTRVPTPQVTPVVSGAYPQSPPRLAPVPGSPPRSAKRKRGAESDESENAAAVEYEANVRRQKKRRLYTLLDSIQDIVIGGLAGFIDYFAYDWNDEW